MIAIQKIGKSFMGALSYNLKKLNHADPNRRAELLDSNFTTLEKMQIKNEVELLRQLRPNLNRYVYHTSLNFSIDEEPFLDNRKLLAIAHDYLYENGFDNHQYLIFRHYDADHPHLHLLVNRIGFDGAVVSDSNNYKKSEAVLRKLEQKYNLMPVNSSEKTKERAAKKDELEMVIRKGKPSDKMLLQQIIKQLINTRHITLQEFIRQAEAKDVHLLFNQATTGRVSGITYFHNGFKIKGQALGNIFKWAEIIKKLDYEQIRDSTAVGEANSRTKAIYGELATGQSDERRTNRAGIDQLSPGHSEDTGYIHAEPTNFVANRQKDAVHSEASQDRGWVPDNAADFDYDHFGHIDLEITDDEDDAKYRRRSRGMGR